MSTRYITGVLFAVLGGFVVVISQTFTPAVLGWVAFGIGQAVVVSTGIAQLDHSRGTAQRSLDGVTVLVAVLLSIFSLAASGQAVVWLTFALALGIVALALTGLPVHEAGNWRARRRISSTTPDSAMVPAAPRAA